MCLLLISIYYKYVIYLHKAMFGWAPNNDGYFCKKKIHIQSHVVFRSKILIECWRSVNWEIDRYKFLHPIWWEELVRNDKIWIEIRFSHIYKIRYKSFWIFKIIFHYLQLKFILVNLIAETSQRDYFFFLKKYYFLLVNGVGFT